LFTSFRWARNIAISTTAIAVCLAGSTIYFANQQARVEVAVVVQDPYGRIENVVAANGFQPDERVKGHLVLKYIEAVRSVSSDRVRLRADLMTMETMTTPQGIAVLAKGFEADEWGFPSQIPANRVRQVERVSVFPPKDGSSTFTAMWREKLWEGGRLVEENDMRGSVSLTTTEGKDARTLEAIKRNPTGLWVDSFRWEKN
jgi:type IV secretory pathway TrbF-like protein